MISLLFGDGSQKEHQRKIVSLTFFCPLKLFLGRGDFVQHIERSTQVFMNRLGCNVIAIVFGKCRFGLFKIVFGGGIIIPLLIIDGHREKDETILAPIGNGSLEKGHGGSHMAIFRRLKAGLH